MRRTAESRATMSKVSKTTWDCRQAKSEIALKAGGDAVDPAVSALLEAHLTECSQCRGYLSGMTVSLESLQTCAADSVSPALSRSLWPSVASRLPRREPMTVAARFNLWVPTAATAAACAAMILVTIVQFERMMPVEPRGAQAKSAQVVVPEDFFKERRFRVDPQQRSYEPTVPGMVPVKGPPELEW